MPLLVYSYPDFVPDTVIRSAQVNAKYDDIKTLLNTTKLDDLNLQDAGITRASKLKAGTAQYVIINGADGKMSEEAALAPLRGGLGISLVLNAGDAGKVPKVNPAGDGFIVAAPDQGPASLLYIYNRFI